MSIPCSVLYIFVFFTIMKEHTDSLSFIYSNFDIIVLTCVLWIVWLRYNSFCHFLNVIHSPQNFWAPCLSQDEMSANSAIYLQKVQKFPNNVFSLQHKCKQALNTFPSD